MLPFGSASSEGSRARGKQVERHLLDAYGEGFSIRAITRARGLNCRKVSDSGGFGGKEGAVGKRLIDITILN